jgi:chromosome segregation protein
MLKGLELVGFKSFADRTRFEFPPGITVIVGPNGSGKSNVVDAVKWVLGEQSIKSLRGKEMADVIFNGSGSRGILNTAECTLTFDNSKRVLAIDSPEVHITRRVYRSGEGEYLINRQVCRLRDIRELFSGTGAATEAYSVIEQGKVDVLLQSSPKERRIIFEEAAGISRFKVKKVESLRRLERVEQNLLRLADIVDEVDNQLRTLRRQAGKAQRYRESTERLRHLRLCAAARDWRGVHARRALLESAIGRLRSEITATAAQIESLETQILQYEREQGALADAVREAESQTAQQRERIVAREATIELERSRLRDLERERDEQRARYALLAARAGGLELERHQAEEQWTAAQRERSAIQERLRQQQQAAAQMEAQVEVLRKTSDRQRSAYMNLMRTGAAVSSQITGCEKQYAAAIEALRQARARGAEVRAQLAAHAEARQTQTRVLAEIDAELHERQETASRAQAELRDIGRRHSDAGEQLARLRERHSAARERSAVLQELEDRLEGVGSAAKELLFLSRQDSSGPYAQIKGLVADLLHVTMESAPLIDAALGPVAQSLVVTSGKALHELLEKNDVRLTSRVGLVRLDAPQANSWLDVLDLSDAPGVLGRADRFVDCEADLRPLVQRLLGRTWIVENRGRAMELAQGPAMGVQLVTLAGEVIGPDGLLALGPMQTAAGLLSRRSELRLLRQQSSELERQIRQQQSEVAALKTQVEDQTARVERRMAEKLEIQHRAAEVRGELKELAHREADCRQQLADLDAELATIAREQQQAETALTAAREQLAAIEQELAAMDEASGALSQQIAEVEQERRAEQQGATASEVALAKANEQVARLELVLSQLNDSQQERRRVLGEHDEQLARLEERRRAVEAVILERESELAASYLSKERHEAERNVIDGRLAELGQAREQIGLSCQGLRRQLHDLEAELHRSELAAREIELEMGSLASRLREDYQLELSEIADDPQWTDERERDELEAEVAELRRKINQMGAVNLEALDELEELSQRHAHLSGQYQDLVQAKSALEHIIGRINADSRRLMAETFETVRGHFQELFAKLFGGGHADIVLEEGVDILESGIEIVARPPGKEPRSISLLSGGEKTLTCVALLLAVFRSRPSPFCVLDEVDAALDEANIERFVGVLKEFLTWTQFIIVTHSKRTMTCAHTLYGVTMQESGVSKRVSVRFEDVSETGEILVTRRDFDDEETAAA